jgi:small-conductance mechanosensitive channel
MSDQVLKQAMISVAIFIGVTAVTLIVRRVFFGVLHRWAARTKTTMDDLLLAAIRYPSLFLCVAIGLYLSIGTSALPAAYVAYSFKVIHVLVILSVTFALANLSARLVTMAVHQTGVAVPVTGLSQVVIKTLVLSIGFLILLDTLGISITPVLTALGVGGLAVALALQDTLGNLFAGIHLLMERSIRVGDFIKLESGQEGYVIDIGWRTAKVRMLPNNLVIIPNSKLAQSVVTNYYMPETKMAVLIPISVGYGSDPEQVERVLVEEAVKAAGEVPGMLSNPAPFVRFIPGFGESSLDFTLICQVKEVVDQYLAQHELRKRIFKRFRQEGIEIPFPIRTVYLKRDHEDDGAAR